MTGESGIFKEIKEKKDRGVRLPGPGIIGFLSG